MRVREVEKESKKKNRLWELRMRVGGLPGRMNHSKFSHYRSLDSEK